VIVLYKWNLFNNIKVLLRRFLLLIIFDYEQSLHLRYIYIKILLYAIILFYLTED